MWKKLRKEFQDRNPLWSEIAQTPALRALLSALFKSADLQRDAEHCVKWAYMSTLAGLRWVWQCPSPRCSCSDAPVTDIRESCEDITASKFWGYYITASKFWLSSQLSFRSSLSKGSCVKLWMPQFLSGEL